MFEEQMMGEEKISIIVTSYTTDRLNDIYELLDSIRSQTYGNVEILFVAERCKDLAQSVRNNLEERGSPPSQVLYNEGEQGVSSARNLGIQHAKGTIIAFVDDDAILFPDWAEQTAKAYAEDASMIGLTGPILPLWEHDSMNWFPREFYWIFSCTHLNIEEMTEVRNGYGTNLSFRREAFDNEQLFRTTLGVKGRGKAGWQEPGAEETEFSLRVRRITGKRIIYHPQVKVKHKVYQYRLNRQFIVKRAYWEGYAKALLKRWYRSADSKAPVLSVEYDLLRRILFRLLPQIARLLFRQPINALRQLIIVFTVLTCLACGYTGCYVSIFFGRSKDYDK